MNSTTSDSAAAILLCAGKGTRMGLTDRSKVKGTGHATAFARKGEVSIYTTQRIDARRFKGHLLKTKMKGSQQCW